mmetsp:Transcript_10722/g.33987  ORF Transcript_10722/g.33987 Transcript_10722/m.33987 type:complete len:201 (+) Transcript_10722:750-1352(+)
MCSCCGIQSACRPRKAGPSRRQSSDGLCQCVRGTLCRRWDLACPTSSRAKSRTASCCTCSWSLVDQRRRTRVSRALTASRRRSPSTSARRRLADCTSRQSCVTFRPRCMRLHAIRHRVPRQLPPTLPLPPPLPAALQRPLQRPRIWLPLRRSVWQCRLLHGLLPLLLLLLLLVRSSLRRSHKRQVALKPARVRPRVLNVL